MQKCIQKMMQHHTSRRSVKYEYTNFHIVTLTTSQCQEDGSECRGVHGEPYIKTKLSVNTSDTVSQNQIVKMVPSHGQNGTVRWSEWYGQSKSGS